MSTSSQATITIPASQPMVALLGPGAFSADAILF